MHRWKHAAACHHGSTIEGECDVFVEDAVYAALVEHEAAGEREAGTEIEIEIENGTGIATPQARAGATRRRPPPQ